MEELNSSYWRKHTRRLLVAGLCGFAFVTFAMRMPVHNRGFIKDTPALETSFPIQTFRQTEERIDELKMSSVKRCS